MVAFVLLGDSNCWCLVMREAVMRIAVFGASGATGRHVVDQVLEAGHEVTVLVRDSSAFGTRHDRLGVVVGDVGQAWRVEEVVRGQDAVISALGTNRRGPVSVCGDGAEAILGAMDKRGVHRLVVVSAHGAAESRDRSLYVLAVWAMQGHKMRDKERMEGLIRESSADWTIVRPPALTEGARTGAYRTGTDLRVGITSNISRADLAEFLLGEAVEGVYVREAPIITSVRKKDRKGVLR
jgi:putative NADH-flavin reductase